MTLNEFFDNLNGGARWDVGVSINRSNSLPLDANSVFASLEAAQNYAAGNPAEGTLANAYPGQVLAVVTDAETIIYYIDANMTLQPVGNTKEVMEYIGEIPEGSEAQTIIEYINKKTEGIATDTALAELQALVAKKVDQVEGYSLVSDTEIERLSKVDNYDDTQVKEDIAKKADSETMTVELGKKVDKVEGYSLVSDTEIERLSKVDNYDETVLAGRVTTAEGKITELETASATHAVKTEVEGELALKADKSVVDAMYTNEQIDEFVQAAKDYADENDADTKYGIVYDSENKKIKLVEGGSDLEIDASDFIKDGMISGVTIDENDDLIITFNTDAGKENIVLPLDQLVDIYTGVEGDRVKVTVNSDKSISAELVAGSISNNYLDESVQASLAKADSALQSHQDITHLATKDELKGVDDKFANYTNTTDLNSALELKADKTQVSTDIATAKQEVIDDAAGKYEQIGVAKGLVDALADGQVKTNKEAIEAINHETDGILAQAKGYADGLDEAMGLRVKALEDVESEKNLIAAVDAEQFAIDSDRKLTLLDVAQGKISGLTNSAGNAITLAEALAGKVDKNGTDRLITEAEAAKLELLVIDEETGQAAISGTVNANQVQGLTELLGTKVDKVEGMGLSANNFTNELLAKLNGIEAGAEINVIEGIKFNGTTVTVGEDKVADIIYNLTIANTETLGGVKSATGENKISVAEDGTMEVNSVNVNKLTQDKDTMLVLNGGSASV